MAMFYVANSKRLPGRVGCGGHIPTYEGWIPTEPVVIRIQGNDKLSDPHIPPSNTKYKWGKQAQLYLPENRWFKQFRYPCCMWKGVIRH